MILNILRLVKFPNLRSFKHLLIALALAPLFTLNAAPAAVTITINQNTFEFNDSPRLADILSPVALNSTWYWPATKVFRLNTALPEQQRQQVLAEIARLAETASPDLAVVLAQLAMDIRQWQLGERVLIPVDFDLARINLAANPRFEAGQYAIQLVARPSNVQLFGAVQRTVQTAHLGAQPVTAYLQATVLSDLAHSQRLWLIQPSGTVVKVDTFSASPVKPMPGALLYVPFGAQFFSTELEKLNKAIVALAVNRMN